MIKLNWDDFDRAVDTICAGVDREALTGVYGVPRGGLPLAVAVSHRLGLPLVLSAGDLGPSVLVLDDIHDTGRTMRELRTLYLDLGPVWVWVTRQADPVDYGYDAVLTDIGSEWVLFPFECEAKAEADRLTYEESRR